MLNRRIVTLKNISEISPSSSASPSRTPRRADIEEKRVTIENAANLSGTSAIEALCRTVIASRQSDTIRRDNENRRLARRNPIRAGSNGCRWSLRPYSIKYIDNKLY